jgi:DNA-binding NarL/FixJ family response regulator
VYLVDDHPIVCAGLDALLSAQEGIEVIGWSHSAEMALCELRERPADVVVVDHRLGGAIDGVELCRRITADPYLARCLAMSASADGESVRSFVCAGASGFLLKHADPDRIVHAVRTVGGGASFIDQRVAELIAQELNPAARGARMLLTPREREILDYVARGLSNREIAVKLCVSTSSVKSYVSNLLRKLGVTHRTEAVAVAAREGLLALVSGSGSG